MLEARVRLGGRCQTGVFKGESFDVGGHWIGAHQPRVRKMIESQGLKFKAQFDEGKHILRMFGKYAPLSLLGSLSVTCFICVLSDALALTCVCVCVCGMVIGCEK